MAWAWRSRASWSAFPERLGGGDRSRQDILPLALAEHAVQEALRAAERTADREDQEAETGQQERDADDDREQGELACHVRRVERRCEPGLLDPDAARGVLDGLLRHGI